jgi:hypothetical protein
MLAAIDVLHIECMAALEAICPIFAHSAGSAVATGRDMLIGERSNWAAWSNLVQGLPLGCTVHVDTWPTLLKVSANVICLGAIMKDDQDLHDI